MVLVPCYRCNRYHRIVPLGNMLSHHKGIVLKSSRPSFLIKRAALGNLKASFHCTHWHRFFPLKKAPPLISVFSPQGRRGKPPLVLTFLPLRLSGKESSTSNQAFLLRRKDVTALRCSEPLRSMDGGPKRSAPGCAGWDRRGKGGDRRI